MKRFLIPSAVLAIALLMLAGCGSDKKEGSTEGLPPGADTVQQGDPVLSAASGFVGSERCASCHPDEYVGWSKTLHNKPLKMVSELGPGIFVNDHNANGVNDFVEGLDFNTFDFSTLPQYGGVNPFAAQAAAGTAPILSAAGGKFFITIGSTTFEVQRTQGGNVYWKQRYHTKIGNGYYVTPVQYNEVLKRYSAYNPANWYSGTTPFFSDPYGSNELVNAVTTMMVTSASGPASSSWENRCAACHQTGMRVEYRGFTYGSYVVNEVVSGYVELNIGCEACHGPGKTHAQTANAADIINPDNFLVLGRRGYYAANEVCGRCHQRGEGFAHFSSAFGTVQKGVEAPSKLAPGSTKKAVFPSIGESILSFFVDGVGAWGTKTLTGTYDTSNTFPEYVSSKSHHQQWDDIEQGMHGSEKQPLGEDLTCWSCHNVHSVDKPHNIRTSVAITNASNKKFTVSTDANENTLCLACHAESAPFASISIQDVIDAPTGGKVYNAVNAHTTAVSFMSFDFSLYLQPVKGDGVTPAQYGLNFYRVGQCISCHLPYTASSSGQTYTDDLGFRQGDIRNHTMKPIGASPDAAGGAPTSCSGCHPF
jgi:hypothetical protein